jgi:hypothetical protein
MVRADNRRRRKMSKSKSTKKATTAKTRKPAVEAVEHEEKKAPREELCVFAFRLTEEERNAIHKAAGPAKAAKFARTLLVAAARNDETAVKAILKEIQASA